MRRWKGVLVLLSVLALIGFSGMVGCGGDDDDGGGETTLLGTWYHHHLCDKNGSDFLEVMTMNADGTLNYSGGGATASGVWSMSGNNAVTLTISRSSANGATCWAETGSWTGAYSLSEDELVFFGWERGDHHFFRDAGKATNYPAN